MSNDTFSPNKRIKHFIERIADVDGLTLKDILGNDRRRKIVRVRHLAIVEVAKAHPWLSTPHLGRIFKRDHSTIQHALRKHGFRVSENGKYGFRQSLRVSAGNGGELNQTQETGVLNEHT